MDIPQPTTIGIIDYGMGNLISVRNAFEFLGSNTQIIATAAQLNTIDAIVLPGIGAFGQAMANLKRIGLVEQMREAVINQGVPFLGICLGMQMLARRSSEMGDHEGLGWINGRVERIKSAPGIRVPHVSWNRLTVRSNSRLFERIKTQDNFYFDHSYQFTVLSESIVAYTDYHGAIPAVIERGNIFATQFHPEKSQRAGLVLLRNFLNFVEERRQ